MIFVLYFRVITKCRDRCEEFRVSLQWPMLCEAFDVTKLKNEEKIACEMYDKRILASQIVDCDPATIESGVVYIRDGTYIKFYFITHVFVFGEWKTTN